MLCKVVAVQSLMGERLSFEEKIHIFKQRPDFVCLPEYSLVNRAIGDYHRAALSYRENIEHLCRLSDELCICLIAGTIVEPEDGHLYNTCFVIHGGRVVGKYRKRRPVPGELAKGITPGTEPLVLEVDGVRIAVLICGDVFFPSLYQELREERVDLIFVPTTSLYRPDDSLSQKRFRDQKYFVDGALLSAGYVVKTCGVGEIFSRPLQGRSLIAAPWGILSQVSVADELGPRMLVRTLDIDELREFRRKYLRAASFEAAIEPGERANIPFLESDRERYN
jgi:predicted amidohydrolase